MPKINVYLPEELAEAVRAAGFPVSPVCQKALAKMVRTVAGARQAIEVIRDPQFDPRQNPDLDSRLGNRMTPGLKRAFGLASEAAGAGARVGTGQLLLGLINDEDNLGRQLLQTLDIDLDQLKAAVAQAGAEETATSDAATGQAGTGETAAGAAAAGQAGPQPAAAGQASPGHDVRAASGEAAADQPLRNLTLPARRAIASALEAAIDLGHNYIGCEHLVLGLLADPDSAAGAALRRFGVEPASARRVVTAALAGYARAPQADAAIHQIMHRLDAIEGRLASLGA